MNPAEDGVSWARREFERAAGLHDHYQRTGDLGALHDAAEALRRALTAIPTGHPAQAVILGALSDRLRELFERTGELEVLQEAIQASWAAVAATPTNHPHRAAVLSTLGTALQMLFGRTGELTVLHEAIRVGRVAVAATATNHPDQAMYLSNLGTTLQVLFGQTGELEVLHEAIDLNRKAVAATPTNHPDQTRHLTNLGAALGRLSERTGDLEALTEAIEVGRAAVAATRTDHPQRAAVLSNLSTALRILLERTGELKVLTEAIDLNRDAVAAIPMGHPDQAMYLTNLGITLQVLSERTGDLEALTEAIEVGRAAVAATPTNHPHRAGYLNELGTALKVRCERTGDLEALTEAIEVGRAAVAATPTNHPDQARHLTNLGITLRVRCERTGDLEALTEAIEVGRAAVAATPTNHPHRAGYLNELGTALQMLGEQTGDSAALTEARKAFADAGASPAASVAVQINAGRGLADTAMLAGTPQDALAALEKAVELVPQLAPRSLSRPDREHGLGRLAGLAAQVAAVAVAAGRPERAVELLEQTRGLLLGEAIDARGDLTELHRVAPALAAEFDNLRAQAAALENAAAGPLGLFTEPAAAPTDQLGERRQRQAEQWTAQVDRIRATAGFEQFLRPPSITRLQRQAHAGPIVVVYVSRWRADALILSPDSTHPVQVVTLPELTLDAACKHAARLLVAVDEQDEQAQHEVHAVLGWLWDTITGPVLEHLNITVGPGPLPRIWWCPVGILAYLPLHAAGHHADTAAAPVPRTVLDRAVSSYTITLRALEHARANRDTPQSPAGSSVIIAMPTTPQAPPLPRVADETKELTRLLDSRLTLTGPEANYQTVAAALPRHRIAHFACHGLSDWTNPATSRLMLHDHEHAPLTVTTLMRLHLADADLAYLSACSTTRTSPTLADEAVHLTAAVQLAGYRHVIGTLWPINDTAAARIATRVYTRLTHDGTQAACPEDSAYALAEATRNERDTYPALPTRWAAHLHLGP